MTNLFTDVAKSFGLKLPELPQVKLPAKVENQKPSNVLPSLVETGIEILRAVPRVGAQLALSSRAEKEFVPGTGVFPKAEKVLFGERPIKSISGTGEETLKGLGASPSAAKALSLPAGLALAGLDVVPPVGGFEKNILQRIAKSTDEKAIATLLRQAKLPEQVVTGLSRELVSVSKAEDVESAIRRATPVTGEVAERGFVQTVKQSSKAPPELKARVEGEYVTRSTEELATKAKNLVKDDIEAAHRVVSQGTDENAVATAMELTKHYGDLAEKAKMQAERLAFYDKQAEVVNEIAPKLTELGRGVQAAAIYSRMTPEGIVRFAAKEIDVYNRTAKVKIPGLTGKQAEEFAVEAKRIRAMPDDEAKAIATQQLLDKVSALVPSSLKDKIVTVWKAGLLTGLKTSGLNILSNVGHGALEIAKDVPAAVVDSVASLFTGERTKTFTVRGTLGGLKEGFEKGWRYFRTGYDERNIGAKLDYRKVNFGTSRAARALQKYEETVFRIIGAEDQPFYYGAKAHSLEDQGIAAAKKAGLKRKDADAFVENFVSNPSDEALKYAVHDAETAVFQNRTALGDTAKAIQNVPVVGPFVAPFTRTPGAVATQVINYTPVGAAAEIITQIRAGKFDQRAFSQAIGRSLTGTGVFAIGAVLLDKGLITLAAPSSERERKQWELEGKKPNSILIDGEWKSLNAFGPAGNVLIIGGYYQDALNKEGSPTKALFVATAGAAKSVTDQTFLKGLSGVLSAVSDPLRSGQTFAENTAGSVIPTIVSDVAQATDPLQREDEGILERLQSRIPVLRRELNARVDVLGKEIPRNAGFLGTMADPFRSSPDKSGPVIDELRRLMDAGHSVTPTEPKDSYKIAGAEVSLSRDQLQDLRVAVGSRTAAAFEQLIAEPEYAALPDPDRAKLLDRIHDKVRRQEQFAVMTADQRRQVIESLDQKGRERFAKELQSAFGN